ncbi:hypothetical protein ACTZWW_09295 [Salinarimonas sp. NSM]|uniref:sulfotransferase-like domain-containing protein n=1 Tax=Salinarimonas sp. NSM TaxID=3458003 RepID=UPI004035FE9F
MHLSIALWGHPRSMSTALERSFMERGDFKVFHEAFSYVYFVHEGRTTLPHQNPDPDHPRTYAAVRDMMERARLETPVFHKDFPYHALDHLLADPDYLLGQINTFLIRDPEEAVLSHANVHPDVTRETLGYEQLARLFDVVRDLTGETPLVINAADLAEDPEGTIGLFCARTGIDLVPEALRWDAGSRPEWSTWEGWHTDVIGSSGIGKPTRKYRHTYEDLPHLRDYVAYCRPFYEHLDQYRVSPIKEAAE